MSQFKFTGVLADENVKVRVNVAVISFTDEGSKVFYCPALDLSGYGDNEAEARESFQTVLSEFFKYTINKNTLIKELRRLGWKVRKSKIKPMIPPNMSDLLRDNENFSNIFNKHDFNKFSTSIEMPAVMA